mmetsp:Transcript_17725/g.26717  ORF Transcript_17725/g.26717 Transcript_17725/m.26717 type:complete len:99 (+) Transcript_17725:756-1052(+)
MHAAVDLPVRRVPSAGGGIVAGAVVQLGRTGVGVVVNVGARKLSIRAVQKILQSGTSMRWLEGFLRFTAAARFRVVVRLARLYSRWRGASRTAERAPR